MKEKIENEIIKKLTERVKREKLSKSELDQIIENEVRKRNYLKENWQIGYAVDRIRDEVNKIKYKDMEEDYKKMEEEWEKLKGKNEKERSKIIDELFIKRFPQLQEGFFKYKGRIFKLGEGVKKTWLGKSFWFQGYVFDESIKDWSPVEYNIFMESVKNGVNIKELPEKIKKHKTE